MSIFTFEHILCLLLSLICPSVYLLNKGVIIYVLEYMLTLISLDEMQNIGTLMRKSLKSEGRAFRKLLK